MLKQKKHKIIAGFLTTVFSLNTVVGFACSVGLDMGFNSKHHHNEEATEPVVHIHNDGKKHIHYEKKNTHNHSNSHKHEQANNQQKPGKKKDNCCNDEVTQFGQADKSIPQSLNIIHPNFLKAFFDVSYDVAVPSSDIVKDIKQFVRSYHPPISEIYIAIQSFRI
ncbi:MAG TPA: hypothetical protein VKB95_11630 [Chitinophagaceae bacterium]|nr:hypothetical protein [Chitinophagaceae bacterium]